MPPPLWSPASPQGLRVPLDGATRESPRLRLIGEMNNTFEASHKLCLIRLKLQRLTYFSLSLAREGWELSTFSFLPNLCLLHQERSRGEGREGGREGGHTIPQQFTEPQRWGALPQPGNPGITRSEKGREAPGLRGCAVGAGALWGLSAVPLRH